MIEKTLLATEEKKYPPKARLFCGLIFTPEVDLGKVIHLLISCWGQVAFISRRMTLPFTQYYQKEMGDSIFRKYMIFQDPVSQDSLPVLKRQAIRAEQSFLLPDRGRKVNIDPGLLLPDKLVLASTKDCAHRPYLSDGVYADVNLVYNHKSFQSLPWTYPDYASEETIRMMNSLRRHHWLQERLGQRGNPE